MLNMQHPATLRWAASIMIVGALHFVAAPLQAQSPAPATPAPAAAPAATPAATPETTAREAARKVFAEAIASAKPGPADIPLAGQAKLKLPANYLFIGQPHAQRLLTAMGNPGDDPNLNGLVMPAESDGSVVIIDFEPAGYVKDDDAKDWKADDLLSSYREGTEKSNEARKKMGLPELEILGWAETPAYDATTHRLVWAMSSRHRGAPADEVQGVNYNTYALGRDGFFMLNLVTDLPDLPKHKIHASNLLAALEFDEGKRYADFNASTDRVAEYGLAALVAGAAAKKLGFFALIFAFLAKFFKVILIAVAAFGGGIWKWIRGRKAEQPVADLRNASAADPTAQAVPASTDVAPSPAAVADVKTDPPLK